MLSVPLSLAAFLWTAACPAVQATALVAGNIAVPLTFNADYAPSALQLLTDGILRYGLFGDSVNNYPSLRDSLRLAKIDLVLGKRSLTTKSGRDNAARAVHNRRLLGLDLNLGLDVSLPGLIGVGLDVSLDKILDLATGVIVDENWGTSTTRLSNSQKDNAVRPELRFHCCMC